MTHVEIKESTEVTQERELATEEYFVVTFTAFENDHLVIHRNLLIISNFSLDLVAHLIEWVFVQNVDLELAIETMRIIRVVITAKSSCSQFWHELGCIMVNILISLK